MTRTPLWLIVLLPFLLVLISLPVVTWVIDLQVEDNIRQSRERLQRDADTMATLLSGDRRFLDLVQQSPGSSYQSVRIDREIVLDGRDDDWPVAEPLRLGIDNLLELKHPYETDSLSCELRLGNDADSLYLHLSVKDDFVVYREFNQLSVHRNDHVQLAVVNDDGDYHRYTIAVTQPGEITAEEVSSTGRALRSEPGIEGRWMATESGYRLELKISRSLLGSRFSVLVADVDDSASRSIQYLVGLTHTASPDDLGTIVYSPSALEAALSELPDRVQLLDVTGLSIIDTFDGHSAAGITAEATIRSGDQVLGRLRLGSDLRVASVTTSWLQFFLVATVALAGCLVSAALLRGRLRGVRDEMKIDTQDMTASREGDAIERLQADLSRTLQRITQNNEYLEKMASRLNHELRTPVSVVKSSLENLQGNGIDNDYRVYVDRASEGVRRLTNILNKMSEARRLEESLDEDEIVRFNLSEVVRGCVGGYETAFADTGFNVSIESDDIPVTGIPEMIAQLLDKLVDNAVEFSEGAEIRIRLNVEGDRARLRVMNEGPMLPEGMSGDLFDSMVSIREARGETHLGLGLYIARLIAEFHGAQISIANREDVQGVMVLLEMPLLRITSRLL